MNYCHLCGKKGEWSYLASELLTKYFTARSICKTPTSDAVCDRCHWVLKGRVWFWNESKQKWSKLFAQSLTALYQGETLLYPIIEGEHTEGKDTLPIVTQMPTRAMIRDWLLNPPDPPFTIAITESGQKYVLPWAQEGLSRDRFPVQFELDSIWLHRAEFQMLLEQYEALMALGFSKGEIDSGDYRSEKLVKCLEEWGTFEPAIVPYRGSRLLQLVSYVALSKAL